MRAEILEGLGALVVVAFLVGWALDPDTPELLHPLPLSDKARFPAAHTLVPIGRYKKTTRPAA